jgi:phage baseplate assembly protein W
MAFNAQQIFPIDFNKSAAVGVNLPFSAPGVFKPNYTTAEATRYNLLNYLLTNPGERPLNPSFGGGLRAFIFEQIVDDNLNFLKEEVEEKLKLYFSNIQVDKLEILQQSNNNTISVSLNYSIKNTNINDTVEIDFS